MNEELLKLLGANGDTAVHRATVIRTDNDGTIWVSIPGGAPETPVHGSLVEARPGDTVQVRIENGRAVVEGNATSPAATSRTVEVVRDVATDAEESAMRALDAANVAEAAAESALISANSANTYANAALDQLGVVQDVVGVLTWASEHGTFVLTQDTAIVDGKVYFTFDSSTGDYTPVVNPQASGLSFYYELTVDEAMDSFIMSHLAVTQRGLWVLPSGMGSAQDAQHAPDYKVLLSNDGMSVYDGDGVLVVEYGESIAFDSGRGFAIGDTEGASYIAFVPGQGITIGGGVSIGSEKTLSELIGEASSASEQITTISEALTDEIAGREEAVSGVASTVSTLADTIAELGSSYNELNEYVEIGNSGLTITAANSPVVARMTSAGLRFLLASLFENEGDAAESIAEISTVNDEGVLKVNVAVVLDELCFGHWMWYERENGNMSLKYTG